MVSLPETAALRPNIYRDSPDVTRLSVVQRPLALWLAVAVDFVDAHAFEEHRQTAHFREFDERTAAWVDSKQARIFQLVDSAS